MKFSVVLVIWLAGASVFAQDTTTGPSGASAGTSTSNPITSLASQFFEHDYFNVYGYANGVYDSYPAVLQSGQTVNGGGFGYAVGGGISAVHTLHDGSFSLSYQGDYRDYQASFFTSGTDQNLSAAFTKRITRRWTFSWSAGAGVFFYGGTFFPAASTGTLNPATAPTSSAIPNPFSPETRFLSTGVSFTYRQTRRLSYIFSGSFYLTRYNYPGAIGATGGTGSGAVQYQVTPRTSVSGSYSYSHFDYTRNAGQASVNGVGLTLSRQLSSGWVVTVSGGFNQNHATGIAEVPVTLIVPGTTQAVGGYVLGSFDQSVLVPSYSGAVSHSLRHSTLSVSAGAGSASTGNGYYLASRNTYINGYYSYSIQRRSNVSLGGYYYRLSSVANAVGSAYSSGGFSANYGTMLMRYVGVFTRYDYIHYSSLTPIPASKDNRISFGLNFSSKSIPMTLF